MRIEGFSDADRITLLRIRQQAAEDGIEMSPEDLIDRLRYLNQTMERSVGFGLVHAAELMKTYGEVPGPPPYPGAFDDLKECSDFKARSEKYYRIKLEIVRKGRLYRLRVAYPL